MIWYDMGLQHYTFYNREMRLRKTRTLLFYASLGRHHKIFLFISRSILHSLFCCFIFHLCLISFIQLNRLQIECNIYAKQWDYVVIWSYGLTSCLYGCGWGVIWVWYLIFFGCSFLMDKLLLENSCDNEFGVWGWSSSSSVPLVSH